MKKNIVIGILPDSNTVQTALDNLAEADFDENDISIVMKDKKKASTIAKDAGPLEGSSIENIDRKLKDLGMSVNEISAYYEALEKGKVLIAIRTENDTIGAAEEMLKDYNIQQMAVL